MVRAGVCLLSLLGACVSLSVASELPSEDVESLVAHESCTVECQRLISLPKGGPRAEGEEEEAPKRTLVQAISASRHGARSPLYFFEGDPNSEEDFGGRGKLLGLGETEHFLLGKALRARYVTKEQLLPAKFDADALHVRSSESERAVQSGISQAAGLYPFGTGLTLTKGEQNSPVLKPPFPGKIPVTDKHRSPSAALPGRAPAIPVYTVPERLCGLQLKFKSCKLNPKMEDELAQLEVVRQWNEDHKKEAELAHEWFGVKPNFRDLSYLGDTLIAEDATNLSWEPAGKDPAEFAAVKKAAKEACEFLFARWFGHPAYSVVMSNPYFKLIGTLFQQRAGVTGAFPYTKEMETHLRNDGFAQALYRLKDKKMKFIMLPGHDINISPLLEALRMMESYDSQPGFAPSLIFELWKEETAETEKDEYSVGVLFNGEYQNMTFCMTANSTTPPSCVSSPISSSISPLWSTGLTMRDCVRQRTVRQGTNSTSMTSHTNRSRRRRKGRQKIPQKQQNFRRPKRRQHRTTTKKERGRKEVKPPPPSSRPRNSSSRERRPLPPSIPQAAFWVWRLKGPQRLPFFLSDWTNTL